MFEDSDIVKDERDNTSEPEDSSSLADAAARKQALDTTRSFIVQAPAGSGKTELLIRRVLCLLLIVEQPEQILAITFTRKAAAEMRNRIGVTLQSARSEQCWQDARDNPHELEGLTIAREVLQRDKQLEWDLLENPERLKLTTIDAFCARLTSALPVTSRLGTAPSPEDNVNDLYRAAAIRTIQTGLTDKTEYGEALRRLLAALDNNVSRLAELLADMLLRRDQLLRLSGCGYSRDHLEQSIKQVVEHRLQSLSDNFPAALDEQAVCRAAAYASEAFKGLGNDKNGTAALYDQLTALPQASAADIGRWRALAELLVTKKGELRKRITKTEGFPKAKADSEKLGVNTSDLEARLDVIKNLLADLSEHPEIESFCKELNAVRMLPSTGYTDEQWQTLEDLFTTLTHAVAELQIEFAATSRCDFTQIAMSADYALGAEGAPTELALELDYRLQHILVDEFQDTSNSQFALFRRIVEGWQSGDGRTFYAVGDPMQSIYRFRHAEVALFEQARNHGINDLPLEPLLLSVNFRSTPDLIHWCNRTFSDIFPSQPDRDSGAVEFSPSNSPLSNSTADSAVDSNGDSNGSQVFWHITPDETQAQKIAEVARDLLNANPGEKHALLVRSRGNLEEMFLALRDAGVPCQAIEMESLSDRPVVADIRSLTYALLYPHDRIAWLSLLRAPWCGLTLEEMHSLVSTDAQHEPVWTVLRGLFDDSASSACNALSEDSKARLHKFVDIMQPAVESATRNRLVPWIESCWMKLGGVAVCADVSDLGAADSMFELLAKLEQNGELRDRARVEERMARLFAPSVEPLGDHIQVMTIHKSKGLEFDSVLLPHLGRRGQSDRSTLLNWFESVNSAGEVHCLMAPLDTRSNKKLLHKDEQKEPIVSLIRNYHSERADNELLRLLYVATTRAKSRLHLFASSSTSEKADDVTVEVKPASNSLLAKLWPAVEHEVNLALNAENNTKAGQQTSDYADSDKQEEHNSYQSNFCRLPVNWSWPASAVAFTWPDNRLNTGHLDEANALRRPEFLWAGIDAAAIGTVVHQQLQLLCQLGESFWSDHAVAKRRHVLVQTLASMGLAGKRLDKGVARVEHAVDQCLSDQRGRWLLDHSYPCSETEYALTEWRDGTFRNVVIDRMFVDQGVRWIVDYKTGDHTGGAVEEFLDREQERYAPQLERYATIVASQSVEPVRLGLYFPLLQGWREWEPSM